MEVNVRMDRYLVLAATGLLVLTACVAPQTRRDVQQAFDELACGFTPEGMQDFARARDLYVQDNGDGTHRMGRETGLNDHYMVLIFDGAGAVERAELWHLYMGLIPSHERYAERDFDCRQ